MFTIGIKKEVRINAQKMVKKIGIEALYTLIARVFGALVSIYLSIVFTRVLGVQRFGTYAIIMQSTTVLATIGNFGSTFIIIRDAHQNFKETKLRNWFLGIKSMTISRSIVVTILSILLLIFLNQFYPGKNLSTIAISLVIVPMFAIINIYAALLLGCKKSYLGAFFESTLPPLIFLLFLLILVILGCRLYHRKMKKRNTTVQNTGEDMI